MACLTADATGHCRIQHRMTHTDLAYLERFCNGDIKQMQDCIRLYLDGTPALFAQLEERMRSGDAEGLAVVTHGLRPQVHFMGAKELYDVLTAIEECARSAGAQACREQVLRVAELKEKVRAELLAQQDPS